MNLRLTFKVLAVSLLLCGKVYTQNIQASAAEKIERKEALTFTQVGLLFPTGLGNNFAAKGMDFSTGVDAQFNFYYDWLDLFLGVRFQNFSGAVTDTGKLGNYEKTRVNLYGLVVGYSFQLRNSKLSFDPRFTLGRTVYRNKANFNSENNFDTLYIIESFRDTATTLMLSGTTNYKIINNLAVYFQPELRWDNMGISTPEELSSFFNKAIFLNISVGVTLFL